MYRRRTPSRRATSTLFQGRKSTNTGSSAAILADLRDYLSEAHTLHTHSKADFLVDGSIVIEVGGPSKDLRQVHDHADSGYLALDCIEVGDGQKVPLYLFGFLY